MTCQRVSQRALECCCGGISSQTARRPPETLVFARAHHRRHASQTSGFRKEWLTPASITRLSRFLQDRISTSKTVLAPFLEEVFAAKSHTARSSRSGTAAILATGCHAPTKASPKCSRRIFDVQSQRALPQTLKKRLKSSRVPGPAVDRHTSINSRAKWEEATKLCLVCCALLVLRATH